MNLVLVLTDRCNRSCRYCYADRQRGASMSFDVARRAIELARERSATPLRIGFFGGEPLLNFPLLREIAEHAERVCDPSPRFSLTTNGDALTDEVATFFGGIDVDVSLSVHDEEVEGTIRAAERLLAEGIEPCAVFVATPDRCTTLAARLETLLAAGIRRLAISPEFYVPWDTDARARLEHAYHDLADLYAREGREERPLRLNQFDMRLDALESGIPLRKSHCELGHEMLTVAPDGTLFPCDRMAVDAKSAFTRIGHLDGDVEERKWSRIASERADVPSDCRTCEHTNTCLGACACVNVHLTGQVNEVPEIVCWHETMLGRLVRELSPALPPRTPKRGRRGRIMRITAGLVATGTLAAACGTSTFEGPIVFDTNSPSRAIIDAEGKLGTVSLGVKLDLNEQDARRLLANREDRILACLQRHILVDLFERLDSPDQEVAFAKKVADEIAEILDVGDRFEGLDLEVAPSGIESLNLDRLQYLGYVGD